MKSKKEKGNYYLFYEIKLKKAKNQEVNIFDENIIKTIKKYLLPNIAKLLEIGLKKNNVEYDIIYTAYFKPK